MLGSAASGMPKGRGIISGAHHEPLRFEMQAASSALHRGATAPAARGSRRGSASHANTRSAVIFVGDRSGAPECSSSSSVRKTATSTSGRPFPGASARLQPRRVWCKAFRGVDFPRWRRQTPLSSPGIAAAEEGGSSWLDVDDGVPYNIAPGGDDAKEICDEDCVRLEGNLTQLEELIARKGYDPKLIDDYFKEHPSQLAARAASVTGSFAKIGWLYSQKNYIAVVEAIEQLGPTYVKFGQALASRADLVGAELAGALEKLQDEMEPAPIDQARAIVAAELPAALSCLNETSDGGGVAIAAASLCQVYKGTLGGRKVAIKVQRPGIAARVAADAALLRTAAKALEATGGTKAAAVDAVDEFASRIFEEMDFKNEAKNIRRFDALYGPNGTSRHALPPPGFVRVPALYPEFPATRRVLIMEWLDGQRVMSLVSPNQKFKQQKERKDRAGLSGDVEACEIVVGEDPWCEAEEEERERAEEKAELARKAASLPLIDLGIRCTLSQLIETGVMHADPHGGNLLRLDGSGDLAYLDFGLVSEVPPTVRDALVAAVTLLVFSRDYEAVAGLFGELMLVPADVIESEYQFAELTNALKEAAEATLIFPSDVKAAIVGNEEAKGAAVADKAAAAGGGAEGSDFVGHMSAWPRAAETGSEAGGEAGYSADEATEEPAKTKGEQKSEKREALLRERGRGIAAVPDVRFDQLLGALLALVPRFRFVLPPYFLNNARALGTLEGMARSADPSFNILAVVYPFAVKRLLANPSGSPVLRRVLRRLVSDEKTGALSLTRLRDMVDDAAALTGVPRDKIIKVGLHKLNPVVTHSLKPPGFIQPFSL